jgi:hypothetical protein
MVAQLVLRRWKWWDTRLGSIRYHAVSMNEDPVKPPVLLD